MPINGAGCATATWIAAGKPANADWSIRGPQKIWDSTLALCGMLYAKRQGDAVFRRYHDTIFERFWKRELDIEDVGVIGGVLAEAGADPAGFRGLFSGSRACRARRHLPCRRGDRGVRRAELCT